MTKENTTQKKLIIKQDELRALLSIRDIGFRKTRCFSDYQLASGEQKLDLSGVKNKKIKKLFIDFLHSCSNIRKRTLTRYISKDGNYVEIRILHDLGYSWSDDVQNEFIIWIINTYHVNTKSKTYNNILNSRSFLDF